MARRRKALSVVAALAAAAGSVASAQGALAGSVGGAGSSARLSAAPATRFASALATSTGTPIKHVVVIFQENVSFDHYFGTYPNAANPAGEPAFRAAPGTPAVNGLTGPLLTNNPNLSNPQRLDRSQAVTCDQDHGYTSEQSAFDHGLMDMFVQDTGASQTVQQCTGQASGVSPNYAVMDYYDGNTVTGMWNYAQHFALNDNSFGDNFGPSTPGAFNVISGNTYGVVCGPSSAVYNSSPCTAAPGVTPVGRGLGSGTTYSDADPNFDICSTTQDGNGAAGTIQVGGPNVGDLLNRGGVSWGWFQGGFASPGYVPGRPSTDVLAKVCTGAHKNVAGGSVTDYSPHHEPFQYYASTANPRHLPPTSIQSIGGQDQANHQYDIRDFFAAADSGNLPAVSFLKAPRYQDGHAGYSDPIDEQRFIANAINNLEQQPSWSSTAVVIAYDDSDGWYDHQLGPIISQSQTSLDTLTGTGMCGANPMKVPTTNSGTPEQARCGVGPRLPLLVISPYAKRNYVDSTETTQSSVVKFIEDNWLGGQRLGKGSYDAETGSLNNMFQFTGAQRAPELILSPASGEPISPSGAAGRRATHRG